jgi:hypothetical protein
MGRRYTTKIVYKWSASVAYCIGLITTDGCLSSDGRHIDYTSKDIELVTLYQKIMKPSAKIGLKYSGHGRTAYRVQIGDTGLYDFLLSVGLTPNKSKTLAALRVPPGYYADFLRGCFDGDGTTYNYWDSRWRSSFMYYIGFASASPPFLEWLREQNTRHAGVSPGSLKPATRSYSLTYAKTDVRKLHKFLYYEYGLPALGRKRDSIIAAFARDPYYVVK